MAKEQLRIAAKISASIGKLIITIIIYLIILILINNILRNYSISISQPIQFSLYFQDYLIYFNLIVSLIFGYLIVKRFFEIVYWNLRLRYDHNAAYSAASVIRIIGIGALVSSLAGAFGGAAAGVALGGFLGIVIGFASQQILGQALAGIILLLSRPFKIGDKVSLVGETGIVEDIGALFTVVNKGDQRVHIPNNLVLGNKIYRIESQSRLG